MSAYSDNLRKQETARFDQWRRQEQLKQVFDTNGGDLECIRNSQYLSAEDEKYLEKLQQEKDLQSKHDAAFLAGFSGQGRH